MINLGTTEEKSLTLGECFAVNKFSNKVTGPANLPLICGHYKNNSHKTQHCKYYSEGDNFDL
jgi:hypothetical protein